MFASEGERETRDTMSVQAGNSSSAEQTLAWKGSVIRKMEEVESEKIIPSRPTGSFFAFNTQTPEAENRTNRSSRGNDHIPQAEEDQRETEGLSVRGLLRDEG